MRGQLPCRTRLADKTRCDSMNAEPPITPDDVREAEAFMKDAFPVRYHFYEMLPDDRPAKRNLSQMMVRKYRQFRRIQEQQPDLYDTMLKQEQLRDQAFGYARDARSGNAEAEDKLRMAVTEMVDLNLKERQARIEKLKKQLDEMMQQLSNDQSQREQKIDEQIDKLMSEIGGPRGRRGAATKPVG